jgi:Ni,Fe-hydrogenase maturation factor
MFNMNEKKFLMKVAESISKVVVFKSAKNVFSVHSENRKWFIVIDAISNDQSLGSMIIFEKKQIQKAWIDEYSEVVYEMSRNDWIDNDHKLAWLKQCFDVQINHLINKSKRLLMMNDHESHVSIEFIKYCW